jgi:hypothetical protein
MELARIVARTLLLKPDERKSAKQKPRLSGAFF